MDRPDIVIPLNNEKGEIYAFIVVEVDENAHRQADERCEWKHVFNIISYLEKPTYIVRFNPDRFSVNNVVVPISLDKKLSVLWMEIEQYIQGKKKINRNIVSWMFYPIKTDAPVEVAFAFAVKYAFAEDVEEKLDMFRQSNLSESQPASKEFEETHNIIQPAKRISTNLQSCDSVALFCASMIRSFPGKRIAGSDLYERYRVFCKNEDLLPINLKPFGIQMKQRYDYKKSDRIVYTDIEVLNW